VAKIHQRATNARIFATGVLEGHSDDEALDLALDPRSPGPPFRAPIVLCRDPLAIPPEKRIGRDKGGYLSKPSSAEAFRFPSEPAALGVCEQQALPVELLVENAVLLLQVLDQFRLVSAEPSGQQSEKTLARPMRTNVD
jgi:hypothetical protein